MLRFADSAKVLLKGFVGILVLVPFAVLGTQNGSISVSNSMGLAVTKDIIRATKDAQIRANVYCHTNKGSGFLVSANQDLQYVFSMDQALRFFMLSDSNGNKFMWAYRMAAFETFEIRYLRHLAENKDTISRLLQSDSSSLQLLMILLHVVQRDGALASKMADYFQAHAGKNNRNMFSQK